MQQQAEFRKGVRNIVLFSLLAFFLIPSIALLFTGYVEGKMDREFRADCLRQINKDVSLSPADKEKARQFFSTYRLSQICDGNSPEAAELRNEYFEPLSPTWQMHWVRKVSLWTIFAGLATLAIIVLLGAIAFKSRQAQYRSFILGWNLLTCVSASAMLIQGTFAVWLAFWLPAYFFERIFPKLLLIIGIAAALAVIAAIINIFRRPAEENEVQGELLTEEQAPGLWSHIKALAAKMGIQPPDQIIAGIDANFFVTEAPLLIGDRKITGRSLFVSLPLLRVLEQNEADAVFMHELAHLHGGDTANSAALGPKLVQYDHYCAAMRENFLTYVVYFPMALYRMIFEFALQRESREREHMADRSAAEFVSPQALVTSLLKINAYASYRATTEEQLFEQREKMDNAIGIAGRIASGLPAYATSTNFLHDMRTANIPHPFDSHPPLPERMQHVGYLVDESQYGEIVTTTPERTWVQDINTANEIEQRLWTAYEEAFAAIHEQALAYRYEPATEEETAIVLKYFPPVTFQLKGDKHIEITYAGLRMHEHPELLSWDDVHNLEYKDGIGGDVLMVTLTEKKMLGHKLIKVHLAGLGKSEDEFKAALGRYWARHQIMRKTLAESEKQEVEAVQ